MGQGRTDTIATKTQTKGWYISMINDDIFSAIPATVELLHLIMHAYTIEDVTMVYAACSGSRSGSRSRSFIIRDVE